MCVHRSPGDVEDCTLELAESGRLVCVQHEHIPRQRTDDLLILVPIMQQGYWFDITVKADSL